MGDVAEQGPHHGFRGQCPRTAAVEHPVHVEAADQTAHGAADIAFRARDLTREEEVVPNPGLHGGQQQIRAADECIAVHLAHAGETAPLQARDQAQDFLLPPPLDVGLETHEVVQRGGRVVLAELHHRVRTVPRARIPEADRPHGAEGQGVLAAAGQDLDGQAAFEVAFQVGVGLGQGIALGRSDSGHEGGVLVRIHRTVDVVPFRCPVLRLLPAVLAKGDGHVDGVAVHNRRHRVEEVQFPFAGQGLNGLGQGLAGQRSRGDDGRPFGDCADLVPSQVNQRMAADAGGDLRGKGFPVDG